MTEMLKDQSGNVKELINMLTAIRKYQNPVPEIKTPTQRMASLYCSKKEQL